MAGKLIIVPLMILLAISLFAMVFQGSTPVSWASGVVGLDGVSGGVSNYDGYFDKTGHPVCDKNGTVYVHDGQPADKGILYNPATSWFVVPLSYHKAWCNASYIGADGVRHWATENYWLVYDNPNAQEQSSAMYGWTISSSLGMLGIISGIMAIAAIAGVRVLGSGVSETSVSTLVKGTAYLLLFGICSINSFAFFLVIPLGLGWVLFFALTSSYTLGIISSIGGGGGD